MGLFLCCLFVCCFFFSFFFCLFVFVCFLWGLFFRRYLPCAAACGKLFFSVTWVSNIEIRK